MSVNQGIFRACVRLSIWIAMLVTLMAQAPVVGAHVLPAHAAAPPHARDEMSLGPERRAAWDAYEQVQSARIDRSIAAAPTDCLGWPTRRIRYTSDGVIHLEGCGQTFTLSDVAAVPAVDASKLELVDPDSKTWLLKVNLKVEEGATLKVIGGPNGDANWLRLWSDSKRGVWLRAENGNLLFKNTKVTSWDAAHALFDTDAAVTADGQGGRAYIAARSVLTKGRSTALPTACDIDGGSQELYEGRMDVIDSEIGYLGYNAAESYGISWKVYYKPDATDTSDQPPPGRQLYALVDIFGDVTGSSFHHNYFGSYTYGAYCMNWIGNTFANNDQYGLDPHDDSDYLTIRGNTFRDNGNHGVICSVECNNLVIADNLSSGNLHGIMIHRNTNGARIEGNTSVNNRGAGIAIFDSHDAVIRNNRVTNNGEAAIRLSVGASRNLIESNTLIGLGAGESGSGYGVYTFKGSDRPTSGDGLPKGNIFRNNQITGYKSPVLKIGEATGNLFEGNTISGPIPTFAFKNAPANRIHNSEVGKMIQVTLDTDSATTIQDSRGYVWQFSRSGLSTSVGTDGSSLNLTFENTGGSVAITTLDLAVRPANGAVLVEPLTWDADAHSWTEHSSSIANSVGHTVGGLKAGVCYRATANGAAIGRWIASAAGRISFTYTGGYGGAVMFAVARANNCPSSAPPRQIFLPIIKR
jgi:mannuronan 5-epimerase